MALRRSSYHLRRNSSRAYDDGRPALRAITHAGPCRGWREYRCAPYWGDGPPAAWSSSRRRSAPSCASTATWWASHPAASTTCWAGGDHHAARTLLTERTETIMRQRTTLMLGLAIALLVGATARAQSEGQLVVASTPPGAVITVDGRTLGKAPGIAKGLLPGDHVIQADWGDR